MSKDCEIRIQSDDKSHGYMTYMYIRIYIYIHVRIYNPKALECGNDQNNIE